MDQNQPEPAKAGDPKLPGGLSKRPDPQLPDPQLPDPSTVLNDARLTRQQKIEKLRRWSYDARELDVANEEGMGGKPRPSNLEDILKALHKLGATDEGTSHKQ